MIFQVCANVLLATVLISFVTVAKIKAIRKLCLNTHTRNNVSILSARVIFRCTPWHYDCNGLKPHDHSNIKRQLATAPKQIQNNTQTQQTTKIHNN